jgi:hypothetical protein
VRFQNFESGAAAFRRFLSTDDSGRRNRHTARVQCPFYPLGTLPVSFALRALGRPPPKSFLGVLCATEKVWPASHSQEVFRINFLTSASLSTRGGLRSIPRTSPDVVPALVHVFKHINVQAFSPILCLLIGLNRRTQSVQHPVFGKLVHDVIYQSRVIAMFQTPARSSPNQCGSTFHYPTDHSAHVWLVTPIGHQCLAETFGKRYASDAISKQIAEISKQIPPC